MSNRVAIGAMSGTSCRPIMSMFVGSRFRFGWGSRGCWYKLPLSCGQRVTFCRVTKSHQKTFVFLTYDSDSRGEVGVVDTSFLCPAASGSLFAKRQKVTKKRFLFSQWTSSADSTSVLLLRTARIPARDHPRSGL